MGPRMQCSHPPPLPLLCSVGCSVQKRARWDAVRDQRLISTSRAPRTCGARPHGRDCHRCLMGAHPPTSEPTPPPRHPTPTLQASCVFHLPHEHVCSGLAVLWRQGALCDVRVSASDGGAVAAHRAVLAASSGYFRALFLGAGTAMREAGGGGGGSDGVLTVALQHESSAQLAAAVEAIYTGRLQVWGEGAACSAGLLRDHVCMGAALLRGNWRRCSCWEH